MAKPYQSKLHTLEQAVALLRPRDMISVPLGPCQPGALLAALSDRTDWEDLTILSALLLAPHPVIFQPGVRVLSGFFGPVERMMREQGCRVDFIPADFRRFTPLLHGLAPRVMTTAVSPPDSRGRFSLSLHAGASVDELHRAGSDPNRLLIVEVNPLLPRTFGLEPEHSHSLDLSEIDVVIENPSPPPTLPDIPATQEEQAIAEHIRSYVHDGMTLQTGIGGVPNAVVQILATSEGGDYGIHSEMFTTSLMKLHQAGKVTNLKGQYDGLSVTTFALGTEELHTWLHERRDVCFLPSDIVNDPGVISRNRKMLSINGALSLDLHGQLIADSIGGTQWSGIGGAEDFVSGASFSEGGHSIVCLPSTATVGNQRISRVMAKLPEGSIVTTPRHQVDVVVTEFGAAELAGRTVRERALALVEVAHPDFRDELREEARTR